MQKTPVEFFGLPFDDEILHDARFSDILVACKEVLQDIGRGEVYNDHFDLASKSSERDVQNSFFKALSRLPQEHQEKCFDKIVDMLEEGGVGSEHIKEHLLKGARYILQIRDHVTCSLVICLDVFFLLYKKTYLSQKPFQEKFFRLHTS